MRGSRFGASWVAGVFAAALAVSAACATSSGDDAGGGPPSATPAQFCAAFSGYAAKCNVTDPCSTGLIRNCPSYSVSFSASYLEAFTACATSEPTCVGEFPNSAVGSLLTANASEESCLAAKQSAFTPTAAQQKYAQDYCAACSEPMGLPSGAACAQEFYAIPDGGSTISELAAIPFDFNDTIVTAFDSQCVPEASSGSAQSCSGEFFECVNTLIAKAIPPPAACFPGETDGGTEGGEGD